MDASSSWASLTQLTTELSSVTWPQWEADGLEVQGFGPDAATDTVAVTLDEPTSADLEAIAATAGSLGITASPVTAATYPVLAGKILAALYGNAVSVAAAYGEPGTLIVDRFTDVSPFFGGDQIEYTVGDVETQCTGGFSVASNKTGYDYMLTAGHCGTTSGWYLTGSQDGSGSGTEMGPTSGGGN